MHRYVESIKVAMEEIRKALDTLSTKDISSTGISARQVIDKGLNHITKVVEALSREIKSPESSDLARAAAEQPDKKMPQMPQMQQEMTSMGGGNGSGVSGGIDLTSDEENLEEDETYLKEGTLPLRKVIREAISELHKNTTSIDFMRLIEQLGMDEPAAPTQPQESTGAALAGTIFPQLNTLIQKQYTMLKTNDAQRSAFKQQLMKAIEEGVKRLQVAFEVKKAGGGAGVQTDIGDKKDEEAFYAAINIPGIEETGKGFALTLYNTIEPKLKNALNGEDAQFGLTDPIDRRAFVKTIVDMTRELLASLEQHMVNSAKPPAPAPAQAVAPKPPAKTNAGSDFMLP